MVDELVHVHVAAHAAVYRRYSHVQQCAWNKDGTTSQCTFYMESHVYAACFRSKDSLHWNCFLHSVAPYNLSLLALAVEQCASWCPHLKRQVVGPHRLWSPSVSQKRARMYLKLLVTSFPCTSFTHNEIPILGCQFITNLHAKLMSNFEFVGFSNLLRHPLLGTISTILCAACQMSALIVVST